MAHATPRKPKNLDFYLMVCNHIDNQSAVTAAARLKMSLQALSFHLKKLQFADVITRIGYGTWHVKPDQREALEQAILCEKQLKKLDPIGSRLVEILTSRKTRNPNDLRMHAFQFVVRLEHLPLWKMKSRREWLTKKKIPFEPRDHQHAEQLTMNGNRVWLTNKSIVIWLSKEWFVKKPDTGYTYAVFDMLRIIHRIERLFNISLKFQNDYWFKTPQQHQALIKNSLAKEYNKQKKKLQVYDERGIWLIIDDSQGLNELENIGVHDDTYHTSTPRRTIQGERSEGMQELFNNLPTILQQSKDTPQQMNDLKKECHDIKEVLQMMIENQKLQIKSGVLTQKDVAESRKRGDDGDGI